MKRVRQFILTGTFIGCSWLLAPASESNPDANSGAGSVSLATNDQVVVSMAKTNSLLVMRGLYASRSKSAGKSGTWAPADAVIQGLRWLQQSQNKDGSWGAGTDDLDATTGIAVLAFLGHGETPASFEFGNTVEMGLKYLLVSMMATNSAVPKSHPPAFGNAIATWAVCEGYGLTRIVALEPAVEKGLAVILKGQKPSGLWDGNYIPNVGGDDIDVSVWQVMALHSGLMMGSRESIRSALGKASGAMKTVLGSKPNVGLLGGVVFCCQLCGEGGDISCRRALNDMATMTLDWNNPVYGDPFFRWYLATQAFFQKDGEHWKRWNLLFAPQLVEHQGVVKDPNDRNIGYWDSPGSGELYGRVYATALSILMLEVYQMPNSRPYFKPLSLEGKTNAPVKEIIIDVK